MNIRKHDITNEEIVKRMYKGETRAEIANSIGCDRAVIHIRAKNHLGYNLIPKMIIKELIAEIKKLKKLLRDKK